MKDSRKSKPIVQQLLYVNHLCLLFPVAPCYQLSNKIQKPLQLLCLNQLKTDVLTV